MTWLCPGPQHFAANQGSQVEFHGGTWLLRQVGWEDVRVKRRVGAEQETKVKGDSELGV